MSWGAAPNPGIFSGKKEQGGVFQFIAFVISEFYCE